MLLAVFSILFRRDAIATLLVVVFVAYALQLLESDVGATFEIVIPDRAA